MPGCERRGGSGWRRVALVGVVCALLPAAVWAAEPVQIAATLIRASNEGGKGGARPGLPGILKNFKSYENYGGGAARVAVPGQANISLGHGNSLAVRVNGAADNRVEAAINWRGPSGPVQATTVRLTRGGPPVYLGGAQQDGGTMIVAITAR